MDYNPENVQTTEDNASAYIDQVNLLLAQEGVVDKEGNPVQLEKLAGSVLWLMALADGQNTTEWQERLRNCYNSLDIANCADEQVNNLAILAGVIKKQGSAPFIILKVKNTTSTPITVNSTNCIATDMLTQNEWYAGQNYDLIVDEEVKLVFYCKSRNIEVPKDITFVLHNTQGSWDDLVATSASASRILEPEETIADLRNAIMLRKGRYDAISQAETAIANLDGISKCSIYFNRNQLAPITLPGGLELPARTAYIVVQGYDVEQLIARTFFSYALVQTLQTQTSLANQVLVGAEYQTVYYDQCESVTAYIKVKVRPKQGDTTYTQRIRDTLTPYSGTLKVGENITTQLICEWLGELDEYCTIISAYVGLAADPSGDTTNVGANKIIQFTDAEITFEVVS